MTTLYDVPTDELLDAVAAKLADEDAIEASEWAQFTKTSTARELPPEQDDFWSVRAASVLRKIAINEPIGIERLRSKYGDSKQGSTRYRVRPKRGADASGNILRTICQQLDEAGYVDIAQGEGRRISADGRSLLDDTAGEVLEDLDRPELERYA
jgi:small subunit ribosomal protein S19e